MSLLSEFKDFALKGNVMDMAIGVIIGGAFSTIVTSLTDNYQYYWKSRDENIICPFQEEAKPSVGG